jgi:hypothetical protein
MTRSTRAGAAGSEALGLPGRADGVASPRHEAQDDGGLPQWQSAAPAIDPFRREILTAWGSRPLDERRAALDRIIEKITLSEGGAHVDYRIKDAEVPIHQPDPSGPPWGACPRNCGWWACGRVGRPRARRPAVVVGAAGCYP